MSFWRFLFPSRRKKHNTVLSCNSQGKAGEIWGCSTFNNCLNKGASESPWKTQMSCVFSLLWNLVFFFKEMIVEEGPLVKGEEVVKRTKWEW